MVLILLDEGEGRPWRLEEGSFGIRYGTGLCRRRYGLLGLRLRASPETFGQPAVTFLSVFRPTP